MPAYYAIAASQPLQRLLARGAGGEILSLEDRLSTVKPVGIAGRGRAGAVPRRPGRGEAPGRALSGGHRPGHDPGRPAVPRRPAVSVTLPEGVYEVRAYLLREGKIVAAVSRPLPVGKVGFSAQLAGWASDEGALYGLGAIVMALFVGWLGGAIMRRL